jgi:thiamine pyrophosphokinase
VRALVVADGEPQPSDLELLATADMVVAADGGAAWAHAAGRVPDLLVGDLDSARPELVADLEAQGTRIERHAVDKDESDTELAVARALATGADEVVLVAALGGKRVDHGIANLLLLAVPEWHARLRIVSGEAVVRALRGPDRLRLDSAVGDLVTLLPLGDDAEGVRTEGMRYPLHGERLRGGRARGLSNVVEREGASLSLERGTLLVIEIKTGGEPR